MEEYDDGLEMGVPAAYYDTWNRHNSIAFCNYKGLRNAPGENNCFLNSAVQVFWHLDVFRRSYRRLTGHSCMGNSCIFCALKAIFTQFQYSDQSSLPPDTLRKALAETFVDQHRYQLGHMDDAAECFENILRRLHLHVATDHNEDTCTAAHCLSHQKFAMTVFDQLVCPCGAKTDPLRFHELVHYVSANALVSQAKQMQETGDILHPDRFGLLLRNAAAMGDIRNCPSMCGKKVQMRRTLLNFPDVVSIGLIWDSERPSGEQVTDVLRSLGTTIMLQDVFHSVMTDDGAKLPKLNLSALVCYYGKHYSTFVFHSKLKVWIYFDDATVREIGPRWEDVVQKCVRSRYQPLLLLYTNPYPTLLPVQTAPQKTTMHPGYKMSTHVSPEAPKSKRDPRAAFAQQRAAVGRRAVTPGPEMNGSAEHVEPATRRAVTPGPEHYGYEPERENVKGRSIEHSRHNSFLVAMTGKGDANRGDANTGGGFYNPNGNSVPDSQPLMGEYVYSNGVIQPSFMSNGDRYESQNIMAADAQYRGHPSGNMPLYNMLPQNSDVQRKESFKKGNRAHGDVIRYRVDQTRGHNPAGDHQMRPDKGRHVRSRSQSHEDTLSISSETNPNVANSRSRSTPFNHENGKAVHGPVQSGLATLPRKKEQRHSKTPSPTVVLDPPDQSHERQGSASSTGSVVLNPKFQKGPESSANRSEYMDQKHFIRKPEVGVAPGSNHHWRQVSTSSQASSSTLTPSVGDMGYQEHGHVHPSAGPRQVHPHGHPRGLDGEAPQEDAHCEAALNQDYISRNMVEKILSKQRLTRHASSASSMSVRSNTSSSSIDSDISLQKVKSKGGKDSLSVEIPYDSLSLESQKDSGYGSSDRNSSSSTGSVTMDPFAQYFISRSMIPPRTVNDAYVQNFTDSFNQSLANMKKDDIVDSPYEPVEYKGQAPNAYTVNYVQQQQQQQQQQSQQALGQNVNSKPKDVVNHSREQVENNKNIYVSQKLPNSQNKTSSVGLVNGRDGAPVHDNTNKIYSTQSGGYPHPKQVGGSRSVEQRDDNDLINFKSGIQVGDILPGYTEASGACQGSAEFLQLCHKAEDMMDKCMLAETSMDIPKAVNCCNASVSYLKQAMQLPGVSQQSYVFAQRKHNSCVMKYRSLVKQSPPNMEGNVSSASSETLNSSSANRSSMTSTDSDGSQKDLIQLEAHGKTPKDVFKEKLQDLYKQGVKSGPSQPQEKRTVNGRQPGVKPPPPQRGVSIGSRSVPVKQGNPPCRNPSPVCNGPNGISTVNGDHHAVTKTNSSVPKSSSPNPDNSKDAELYQTYVNRQKNIASGMKYPVYQSSSGTSTPTSSVDSEGSRDSGGRDPPPTHLGKSYSKAEIRHLLQQNMMHKQNPQGVAPVRVPQQQGAPAGYPNGGDPRSSGYPNPPKSNLVRNGAKPSSVTSQRPSLPVNTDFRGPKPQIACKPVVSGGDCASLSMHPSSGSARMPPSEYQTREFVYGSQSRPVERGPYHQDRGIPFQQQQQRACSAAEHSYLTHTTHLGRDKSSRSTYSSQPDLSSSGVEEDYPDFPPPASLSAPSTPAHSSENLQDLDCKPSVKDIASRFEATSIGPQGGRTGRRSEPDPKLGPHRQRSKSESSSGPKPVLKKRKKPKARGPRKSVTFSDSIALIAAAEELPPGPAPPPYEEAVSSRCQDRVGWEDTDTYYGYDSDDDIVKVVPAGYADDDYCDKDSCGSNESPVETADVLCSLCHKKGTEPGTAYCSNCCYYMSRFQPNR